MSASIADTSKFAFHFEGLPPLEPGDRLTRAECERRWEAMPELKRAELIEGVVYSQTVTISDDDYHEGAPELIVQIASSSASYDLGVKLNAYRRNGVPEYVVWRVLDGEFDWFVLHEGEYRRRTCEEDGIVRSSVFPGLWLDTRALLDGQLAAAFETLERGLATPEHETFAKQLGSSSA